MGQTASGSGAPIRLRYLGCSQQTSGKPVKWRNVTRSCEPETGRFATHILFQGLGNELNPSKCADGTARALYSLLSLPDVWKKNLLSLVRSFTPIELVFLLGSYKCGKTSSKLPTSPRSSQAALVKGFLHESTCRMGEVWVTENIYDTHSLLCTFGISTFVPL